MYGRAEVVKEPGEGKRKSARTPARLRLGLEDLNLPTRLRENNGRGQTVGTCSDDDSSTLSCGHEDSL